LRFQSQTASRADDRGGTGRGPQVQLCVPRIFGAPCNEAWQSGSPFHRGEFDHRGFAEQNRADAVEMFDDPRVVSNT